MGNTSGHMSGLTELSVIQARTHFTFAEIKRLVSYFRKLKGFEFEGKDFDALLHSSIDKETFKRSLQVPAESEHGQKTDALINRLFEAFDSNKSGAVSLQEFVHGLSVCMRGSVVEQADLLFKLFDANCDGHITKEELSVIFSFGAEKDIPDVAQLFAESDANKDGLLTKEEFRDVVHKHPNLLHFVHLHAFDNSGLFTATRYLVLVNGSLEADRALELSLRHAKAGDELHLLYVHPPLDTSLRPPHVSPEAWAREEAKRADKMRGLLDAYRVRIEASHKHLRTRAIFAEGTLLRKVIDAVDTCDIDVLVLSRHHYSHSKEDNKLGLGHDATEIVQHCSCSVLVVK